MTAYAPTPDWQARCDAVRAQYLAAGVGTLALDEAAVTRSWRRCLAVGLSAGSPKLLRTAASVARARVAARHPEAIRSVTRVADALASSVRAAGAVVVVIDTAGTVIHASGDEAQLPVRWRELMRPGLSLAERQVGTTAPTLAVIEHQPQVVIGEAHYCRSLQPFFCAAVPIADAAGGWLGAIDISAYDRFPRVDALGLLRVAADRIEDEILLGQAEAGVLYLMPPVSFGFPARPGLVAVGRDGRAQAINRVARDWLGDRAHGRLPTPLTHLFGDELGHVERAPCRPCASTIDVSLPSGLTLIARYGRADSHDAGAAEGLVAGPEG